MPIDLANNPEARPDRPRWRVGLAPLMGLVAVVAVGLATMKAATDEIARFSVLAGLVVLPVGTLGAIVRRQRGAWVGFTLFGSAYAVAALVPPLLAAHVSSPIGEDIATLLPVAEPVEWAVNQLHPDPPYPVSPPSIADVHHRLDGKYYRVIGDHQQEEIQLSPDEAKVADAYLDEMDRYHARAYSARNALRIGLVNLGLTFAFCGAILGHALSDRTKAPGASSEVRPSGQTG